MARTRILGAAPAETVERIVKQEGNFVYRIAYSMTSRHVDAEDVMQTVFLKLFQCWFRISTTGNLRGWLARTTTNASIDLLNARRRGGPKRSLDDAAEPEAPEAAPGHRLEKEELDERILHCLNRLPPQQRAALILFDREGLSGKEVERILGISDTTVRSYVHEARLKMREYLKGYLRGSEQ